LVLFDICFQHLFDFCGVDILLLVRTKSEWQMRISNPNGKREFQMVNENFESEWQMKSLSRMANESNPNGK